MNGLAEFLTQNITIVYFFYGLSFFSMGLAIFLEVSHTSDWDFAKSLRYLAAFGILHGAHEWFEMLLLSKSSPFNEPLPTWISITRVALLAISFLMLVVFGARLITGYGRKRAVLGLLFAVLVVWAIGLTWVTLTQTAGMDKAIAADVYTRYSLAIPGTVLTSYGLILQCRKFRKQKIACFGHDLIYTAAAFSVYGLIGQLFTYPSALFPSIYLNVNTFVHWFGLPIQVFRAIMAALIAILVIRSLRGFELDKRNRIEKLREARLQEKRRLEILRAELLHRTVQAQEAERQRIARELHDETGQTLTALGLGLRGLSETIHTNPQRAIQQATQLETLARNGLDELQRLVGGLHPPQLDDLGLLAALRWYTGEITKHFGLLIELISHGDGPDLNADIRIVFFRIAQEAITNVIRHAQADKVWITLESTDTKVSLRIEDDGVGFEVDKILDNNESKRSHWGLLGMIERATLIGGQCQITSQPGQGSCVQVQVEREVEND